MIDIYTDVMRFTRFKIKVLIIYLNNALKVFFNFSKKVYVFICYFFGVVICKVILIY